MRKFVFKKVKIKELMTYGKTNSNDARCFVVSGYSNLDSFGSSDRSSSYQDERILC